MASARRTSRRRATRWGSLSAAGFGNAPDRIAVRINSLCGIDGVHDLAAMVDWPLWPAMIVVPKVESGRELEQIAAISRAMRRRAGAVRHHRDRQGPGTGRRHPGRGAGGRGHRLRLRRPLRGDRRHHGLGLAALGPRPGGQRGGDGRHSGRRRSLARHSATPTGWRPNPPRSPGLGFAGKVAIHPDQVGTINHAFTPSPEESARARAVLEASARAGGGAFAVEGRMVDAPVLRRAQRIAAASRTRPGESE